MASSFSCEAVSEMEISQGKLSHETGKGQFRLFWDMIKKTFNSLQG